MKKDKSSSSQLPTTIDLSDLLEPDWQDDIKATAPSPTPKVGEQSHITTVTQDSNSSRSGQGPAGQSSSSSISPDQTVGSSTSQSGRNARETNDEGVE